MRFAGDHHGGWPGSVIEQLKVVGPLTDPICSLAESQKTLSMSVIPSLPGYGFFRCKPTATGWDLGPNRTRLDRVLMKRLGYQRFVAQGVRLGKLRHGVDVALKAPPGIATGISHQHGGDCSSATSTRLALGVACSARANFSADELRAYDQLVFFYKHGLGYAAGNEANRPQTLYGIADSPVRTRGVDS